jgi:hypothetical protein
VVLYNPAKMRVMRYRYRGAQISTPYNVDEVDPAGARFRRTDHDDVAFVGQVSSLSAQALRDRVESRMRGNVHVRFGGRGQEDPRPKGRRAS